MSFEVGSDGVDPSVLETMTLRDSLHQCQQALRELQAAIDTPRLQRPQATPVHGTRPSFGFNPNPKTGLRDLQAIDDIQEYLRDSLVEIKPGDFDSLRDQLIDAVCRLEGQLHARGSGPQWLVWMRWFGNEYKDDLDDRERDFMTYSAFLAEVLKRWAVDEEDLSIEASAVHSQSMICCSGALALATLSEISGGWMFVRTGSTDDGRCPATPDRRGKLAGGSHQALETCCCAGTDLAGPSHRPRAGAAGRFEDGSGCERNRQRRILGAAAETITAWCWIL